MMTKAMRFLAIAVLLAGCASTAVSAKSQDAFTGPHQDSRGTLGSAQQLVSMDMASVRSMLTPHGWRVERSSAGDLLLYPGAAQAPFQPDVQQAPGFSSYGVARLRARLEPHGWRVESDVEGSVLLFPRSSEKPPRSAVAGNAPSGDTPAAEGLGIKAGEMETLRARLIAVGWKVESDATGSLLLFPRDARVLAQRNAVADLEVAGNGGYDGLIRRIDWASLGARLVSTGWRVISDHERGGLRLLI